MSLTPVANLTSVFCVLDTCGNLPPVLLIPLANLPPVSTTLVVTVQMVSLMAKLPPVSLIPVVHLDLQISPRIFGKNSKLPYCYFHELGGRWFVEKKPDAKIT